MGQVWVECCGGEEKTRGRIDSDSDLKVNIFTNTKLYLHSYVSRVYYCNFHNTLHPHSGWYDGWQTEENVQVLQPF